MILKGVQFFDYACFVQQFVPVQTGLNLLVGKNNAGKTALLKGIAALSALPLAGWNWQGSETSDFLNSLQDYWREPGPDSYYRVEIIFQLEEGDSMPVRASRVPWPQLVNESEILAAYKFWFLPAPRQVRVVFDSCDVRIPGRPELTVIVSNERGLLVKRYELSAPGEATPGPVETQVIQGGQLVTAPDGKSRILPLPATDHYFDGLAPFANARYVSPHRVVTPWIEIQTQESLPEGAGSLSVFLQTLYGRNRRAFQQIENFVISVFPEFTAVNPASEKNQVRITLSRRDVGRDIPLTHCGTGVEQILAIATFAVTAEEGAVLLVDEPHSFLHPAAERQLIEFLKRDQKHRYVVGTHSAVFMNSVEANKIAHIEAPGRGYAPRGQEPRISRILLDLGYRNSDVLFYDALVILEGKSDRTLLPTLLTLAGIPLERLTRVGFPTLEGAPGRLRDLQTAILKYEKLITALSQADIRRVYLLDGDRSSDDVSVLNSMRIPGAGGPVPVRFLPRAEIENYLLSPSAIEMAIREEAELAGVQIAVSRRDVEERIASLLASDDPKLFPRGKGPDPAKTVKASLLLLRLYESFGSLVYDKDHSGTLISRHVRIQDQPTLSEIRELLADLLPE